MTTSAILEQTTFSTGEISPALYGRVDLQRYTSGLRLCENMFVKAEGGVTKRPGTKFVAPTKDQTGGIQLIPSKMSTSVCLSKYLKLRMFHCLFVNRPLGHEPQPVAAPSHREQPVA